jgi:hypothetical protein
MPVADSARELAQVCIAHEVIGLDHNVIIPKPMELYERRWHLCLGAHITEPFAVANGTWHLPWAYNPKPA